ncbi:hypothetical protein LOZ58_006651 [Ophidiomyces ophidiicola]|nr:hypothetical protein LOZ58_006651 [Ophidiomyces ophidiicola]
MASIASSTLPYVIQSHREPSRLGDLDNDIDASTPCSVSRRASVAQGMALLTVWERSLRTSYSAKSGFNNRDKEETAENIHNTSSQSAVAALQSFSESVKHDSGEDESTTLLHGTVNGHFGPLWGTVCLAMGVNLQQTSYVFILNHAKAVLSAAVRSSVMGPYQAQEILASEVLQDLIWQLIEKEWYTKPEDAGQIAPVIDLWMGRHELLYSRIFNS